MTAYSVAMAGPLQAEPDKRVNYTLGLVLGVDEFQQEQLYHMAGRRWHNRLLHGYGTVWGLALTTPEPGDADPELRVSAGVAVDPCGREICVPDTMCVRLNGWLDRHRDTLADLFPPGTTTLPLAVVLCYRACPDDVVPIPGEPCRTQEDAMQPSRVRDSFELRLALREDALFGSPPDENETGLHLYRPAHVEEEAVRAFGELLASVEAVSVAPPGSGREELLAAVLALGALEGEASPPTAGGIVIPDAEAPEIFREAFRVWATEVRPLLRAREPGGSSCGRDGDECCVLLAEVDLPVTAGWAVGGTAFAAGEENRPVLLHTRLLQEWLSHGGVSSGNDDTFATLEPIAVDAVRVWLHYPEPLDLDAADVEVRVDGGASTAPAAVAPVGGVDNVFDVQLTAAPADGATVELRLDLTGISVVGTAPSSLADALQSEHGGLLDRYGPAVHAYTIFHAPALPDFEQDLEGSHPAATVIGLQGNPVSDAAPSSGDVLTWDGAAWAPAPAAAPAPPLPPGSGDVTGTYPALEVVGLRNRPVAATAPVLNQYLRWNGSQWTPAHVGGFVLAPAGRYSVVGAGHFDQEGGDITPVDPFYNGITIEVIDLSPVQYLVRFDEYEMPAGRHIYVFHAALHTPRTEPVPLAFMEFLDEGILLALLGERAEPVGRIIIEISRIG